MFLLVAYDITHHRTRRRVARALEACGTRVQRSVFECLLTPRQYRDLRRRLERLVQEAPDSAGHICSIRLYRLCARCRPKVDLLGGGVVTSDAPFYLV